jgi:UPF0755 protein
MKKIIILLLIILIAIALWASFITLNGQSGNDALVSFEVEEGQVVQYVARNLKENGLLDSELVFLLYMKVQGYESRIQSGEHTLKPSMSIRELANTLVSGASVINERKITIPEGWNLKDIGHYLEGEGIAQAEELMELVGFPGVHHTEDSDVGVLRDFSEEYPFLASRPKDLSYEGYLFPDTYTIYKDASIEDIVNKMFTNFEKKIDQELLDEIDRQGKTLHEVLTLASVVQEESTHEDMARVAGVFYNRLKDGMPLQSDVTVNYITGKITDRPTYDDIEVDSLYNTYEYPGLPPGPVANPGLDAIKAVIYPEKNNYYYFLNPPEGGELIFATTFEQHKLNRAKYLD